MGVGLAATDFCGVSSFGAEATPVEIRGREVRVGASVGCGITVSESDVCGLGKSRRGGLGALGLAGGRGAASFAGFG